MELGHEVASESSPLRHSLCLSRPVVGMQSHWQADPYQVRHSIPKDRVTGFYACLRITRHKHGRHNLHYHRNLRILSKDSDIQRQQNQQPGPAPLHNLTIQKVFGVQPAKRRFSAQSAPLFVGQVKRKARDSVAHTCATDETERSDLLPLTNTLHLLLSLLLQLTGHYSSPHLSPARLVDLIDSFLRQQYQQPVAFARNRRPPSSENYGFPITSYGKPCWRSRCRHGWHTYALRPSWHDATFSHVNARSRRSNATRSWPRHVRLWSTWT